MSKRSSLSPRVLPVLAALSLAMLWLAAPALAADKSGKANPKPAHEKKVKPAESTAIAPAPKPKPAKAPKGSKPPEKSSEEQRAEYGPWASNTNWLSFRAGYARATSHSAPAGLGGYGMAYQHMITPHWGFGASFQHDILGQLNHSFEISAPFTAEFTRHFNWHTAAHPYLGLGGGYYFHKYYRTGGDSGSPGSGWYVNGGFNMPIDGRHLLGFDARMSFVSTSNGTANPVFGVEKASETLWSAKLNWTMAY